MQINHKASASNKTGLSAVVMRALMSARHAEKLLC